MAVAGCTPLVSILTPSYNQGVFLRACLQSVAEQSYPRIEHIVCDGGSTDDSVELLEAAGGAVRWVSEPDRGQSHAVNKAMALSRGELVGWINSDDALFSTDAIQTVVQAFATDPRAAVVYGNAAVVDASGRILRHCRTRAPTGRRMLMLASPIVQPAAFFRRAAIGDERLLREDLHAALDHELWLRLRARGARFHHVDRVLAIDRDHASRKVRSLQDAAQMEYAQLSRRYGVRFASRPTDRLLNWFRRLGGLPEVLQWKRRYQPAFPWRTDSNVARVRRQIATTHSRQTASALAARDRES